MLKDNHYLITTGAELFAKRRKRSEKWVVGGEQNGYRHDNLSDISPQPVPILSPLPPLPTTASLPIQSYLPESAQRLQNKQKLDEIQVSYHEALLFSIIKTPKLFL